MSRTTLFQTSFNKGELDPALSGRTDWQAYFSGAKTVRNMILRPQGGALKRAGTEFIVEALDQAKPSVLIRFQFSVRQVYLLEFSDYRFRVLMDGGVVVYPKGHALAGRQVVIDSPYSAEQMRLVRTAQTQDVMILTHPEHRPRSLARKDHHVWEFEPLEFGSGINPPSTLKLTKDGKNGVQYVVSAITATNEESIPGDAAACGTPSGSAIGVPNYNALTIQDCRTLLLSYGQPWPYELDVWSRGVEYITGTFSTWGFLEGILGYSGWRMMNNNGNLTLELWRPNGVNPVASPYDLAYWLNEAIYGMNMGWGRNASTGESVLAYMRRLVREYVTNRNNAAAVTGFSKLAWPAAPGAVRYRVYRSAATDYGTRFYPIGETAALAFDDDNLAFLSAETPQMSVNPFTGPDNYPGVCLFYQQRLILARTNNRPNTVWGSRVGAYKNFNRQDVGEDGAGAAISASSAFEHTFQADQVNAIDWGVSMDDLLFGTAGGEFRMSGSGGPLSAVNVTATRQSNYGCAPLAPIVIGQAAMGVGRGGRVLRSYRWDYGDAAYKGTSVSHYAGHLFGRREIVGLAYQFEPECLLWAAMSDGALLSCVYMSDEDVLGWSRHDTDGRFEAVVNMSSLAGDDEIWLLAAREIGGKTKRCIERLKRVQDDGDDVREAWHVDCGLRGFFPNPKAAIGGLGHLEGRNVVCLGDGNVFEGLTVRNGSITLPEEVFVAIVGLPFTAELETMDLEPLGGGSIAQQAVNPIQASILFYHARECLYGRPEKHWPVKFWNDREERPLPPRSIRKGLSIPVPPKDAAHSLWLSSPSPVPFGVLSLALAVNVGEMAPNPGKASRAG